MKNAFSLRNFGLGGLLHTTTSEMKIEICLSTLRIFIDVFYLAFFLLRFFVTLLRQLNQSELSCKADCQETKGSSN